MRFDLNEFLTSAKKPYTASFSMDLSGRDWPDYQVPAPVAGTFTVNRTLDGAQISLEAEAAVEAECARCLAPVHETYQIAQQYTVRPRDLEDPDFELPLDEDGLLDVEELVYQEILLTVPRVLAVQVPIVLAYAPSVEKGRRQDVPANRQTKLPLQMPGLAY